MMTDNLDQVKLQAKKILNEYDLCDYCIGRIFKNNIGMSSSKLTGKKIRLLLRKKNADQCYVCKNQFETLHYPIAKIIELSSDYQFLTFLIGVTLKHSIIERDDLIKSKFKLYGIDSIKSEITNEMAKSFAKKTKTNPDNASPDLIFKINLKDSFYELRAKSIILSGRYTKKTRNLIQKQRPHTSCLGKGCFECNFSGMSDHPSVEGFLTKPILEKFRAEKIKTTWIGGEEKTSMVLGKGRPFFLQIINPKKRRVSINKKIIHDDMTFFGFKTIKKIPADPIKFRSKVKLYILTEKNIPKKTITKIENTKNFPVSVYMDSDNYYEKQVYDIKCKKITPKSFSIFITVEGGFPVKRFIEGNDVEPNLIGLFNDKFTCKEFDFQDIVLE